MVGISASTGAPEYDGRTATVTGSSISGRLDVGRPHRGREIADLRADICLTFSLTLSDSVLTGKL
ncbi:hypothetical protein BDY19DRAFT_416921 [Irpex rosettiformis]|uniref:Uncharacterized protein n=1 Tax=Irpex rosettiformis TaxID=378272 RepID=A0ACB8UG34_9APHY|nr:hypothetical protein BDY19DRAFT_416921 [Irpex rosettiformis]